MLHDYEVPTIFQYNLFDVLGAHKKRPLYRWIVIGPARSGTSIHIDPLGTSAWNALIHGHKRWVFIHPDTPRELVHIPKDQRGVHPKEAVTWFNTVYKRICEGNWPFDKYPVLECRQNPGETLFVPCGWWHVVINEDETVAVTQNFCSPVNLVYVYPTLLKQRPNLAQLFIERLSEEQPELMDIIHESMFDPKPITNGYTSSDDEESSECSNDNDDDDDSDTEITLYSTDLSYFESEEEDYESEDHDHTGDEANKEDQMRRGAGDEAPSLSDGSQQSGRGLDAASEEGEGDAKMQTFMDQVYKPPEQSSSTGLKRRTVKGST